jgi:hypothetical protein
VKDKNKQLALLRKKYGTRIDEVEVTLHMTALELEACYGPMCKEYEPACACCEAWVQWNRTGTVTVSVERDEILKILGV